MWTWKTELSHSDSVRYFWCGWCSIWQTVLSVWYWERTGNILKKWHKCIKACSKTHMQSYSFWQNSCNYGVQWTSVVSEFVRNSIIQQIKNNSDSGRIIMGKLHTLFVPGQESVQLQCFFWRWKGRQDQNVTQLWRHFIICKKSSHWNSKVTIRYTPEHLN